MKHIHPQHDSWNCSSEFYGKIQLKSRTSCSYFCRKHEKSKLSHKLVPSVPPKETKCWFILPQNMCDHTWATHTHAHSNTHTHARSPEGTGVLKRSRKHTSGISRGRALFISVNGLRPEWPVKVPSVCALSKNVPLQRSSWKPAADIYRPVRLSVCYKHVVLAERALNERAQRGFSGGCPEVFQDA